MAKILVTGGSGYIGSHVRHRLLNSGHASVNYDSRKGSSNWPTGDHLSNLNRLREVFAEHSFDAVIHLAACTSVAESVENPQLYYENNVVGSLNLVRVMREFGVTNLIFSSTAAVYGEQPDAVETSPLCPNNPYAQSKAMFETILTDLAEAYGLNSVILRYFNVAGADESGLLGEAHVPETHLIPRVLGVAMGMESHITVYGNDYDTPDGTCIRDYVHVTDLVQAHGKALQSLLAASSLNSILPSNLQSTRRPDIYNLGSGRGYSVLEVIEMARFVTGHPIPIAKAPRRPGDVARLVANCNKALTVLEWKPQWNSLRAMVESAWKWHNRHSHQKSAEEKKENQ